MKTKKVRIALLMVMVALCLLALGCDPDPIDRLEAVRAEFPGGDVQQIPGSISRFIARDDRGAIWIVRTGHKAEVTHRVILFDAPTPSPIAGTVVEDQEATP